MIELKDRYNNPPVIEIALEIKFALNHSIPNLLGLFQKSIIDEYPIASEMFSKQVKLDNVSNLVDKPATYEFYPDNSKSEIIRLTKSSLGFITRKYKDYNDFREKFSSILNKFNTLVKSEKIPALRLTRLGLRYINLLEMPDAGISEFDIRFVNPFSVDFIDKSKLGQFEATIIEKENYNNDTYNIRTVASMVQDENKELKYLLDFDAWNNIDESNLDNLIPIINDLHYIIKSKFATLITEGYVKIMEEEKNE